MAAILQFFSLVMKNIHAQTKSKALPLIVGLGNIMKHGREGKEDSGRGKKKSGFGVERKGLDEEQTDRQ